jgi:hypothetical protein
MCEGHNFIHGHGGSNIPVRGTAYYEGWMTSETSLGVLTNWLVMCGQNGNSVAAPDNIIADGE